MLNHALFASFADSADQRVSDRRLLRLEARAATPAGEGGIEVHNLSRTGMLVECAANVPAGATIEVELPSGSRHSAEVVWADERLFGCRFVQPLTQAEHSAALLRSTPQTPPVTRQLSPQEAMDRLREHWDVESDPSPVTEHKLPLATRLWIIGGLGLTGWAVPAAAAWMFF